MTQEECPPACQIAADLAVKKVFALLGVDVEHPESVAEFQDDLRFGRRMRRATEHGFMAAVGVAVVGMGAVLFAGIMAKLGGGSH